MIRMNIKEIQQKIVQYGVSLSTISAENIETGFLSMNRINPLENNQVLALSQETEKILIQFVQAFSNIKFERYDSGNIFQYVFDKVVEVTYKVITDSEIDTQFIPKEVYEYHEPDLPEYIQLKLTNKVGKLGIIHCRVIDYIEKNEYRTDDLNTWLLPLLLIATFIGIEFAQEIDLDDDSEMKAFMNF